MSARVPSFGAGVAAAAVLSVGGAAALAALSPWLGDYVALRAAVALLGLAHVGYVLAHSRERLGRVSIVAAWLVAAGLMWAAEPPIALYVLAHAALAALVRSLYWRSGLLALLADLCLAALGLAFGMYALTHAGSPLLAFWCFFLVQALHAALPGALTGAARRPAPGREDAAFCRAQRAAEDAVRRLTAGAR